MTTSPTSTSISRLSLEISEYFNDFKDSPHSTTEFDALLRNIGVELDGETSWKTKHSDKLFAYDRFVEAHHILVSENAKASAYGAFIAGKILCSGQWWRRFVKDGHIHLLAALLIACVDNTVDPRTRGELANTVLAWTKRPFDVNKQDGIDLARVLFGDAWVTLYEDELTQGFTTTFKTLLTTQPPLVFYKSSPKKNVVETLPCDLAFP